MKVLLIDGYVDEPGCLGVPPYLAPYPRYLYGALIQSQKWESITYWTIVQFRDKLKQLQQKHAFNPKQMKNREMIPIQAEPELAEYIWVIILTGVSVPGNYLGGKPIKFSELKSYANLFPNALRILCGPGTKFGIGEEGGKPSIPATQLAEDYHMIITGDAERVISLLLQQRDPLSILSVPNISQIITQTRQSMDEITEWALRGTELIKNHPNFQPITGGNLICEIETFRGCPRYKTGGCSFCIEASKGPTIHRSIDSILQEIEQLYQVGVRHFRIGSQTDFYAYQHKDYDHPRYPRPNPEKIIYLLQNIRDRCPEIKTLHIDNVNALNFALYPIESRQITEAITKYCTPGNIAAIGVESVDPEVIRQNNLKVSEEEVLLAIKMINEIGGKVGINGNPTFLPGLNFIMGLRGETRATLDANYTFLRNILNHGLLLRRINIRKLLASSATLHDQTLKEFTQDLEKDEKYYIQWKEKVRDDIDLPMLQRVYPIGRVLSNVWAEQIEGSGTYLRQAGTYPILCYVAKNLPLNQEYTLRVIDHGYRSLTCLVDPVNIIKLSIKEIEHLPGVGKKRAVTIFTKQPKTETDWLKIVTPQILETLKLIQPNLLS